MLFQHRQLIQRGAVENHVGILLIGENPPLFPPLHAVPHGKRMLHRRTPGLVVPDNAPQEPQVTGGNPVVIVQIQGQQRADVKAENQLFVHAFRQHGGVQTVKPLHNDDGIRFQTQPLAPPLPFSGEEVEGRKLHFPARQQRRHILPEQGAVNGVDMLQIQFTVRAGGNFVPVYVIVVQTHENGLFPMDAELGGKTVRRGCLARGAGASQQHGLRPPLAHLIGHLRKPLFVQGFVYADQLPDAAGIRQVVEVGHRLALHQLAPALALVEHAEKVGHRRHLGADLRIAVVRIDEHKAAVRRENVPHRQIPGGGHHLAVVIVGKVTVGVLVEIIHRPPRKKPCLVGLPFFPEPVDGLLQFYPAADQGNVLPHQLTDPRFQGRSGKILCPHNADVHAGTQRAGHFCRCLRPQLPHGKENRELRRADIALLARRVGVAEQADFAVGRRHRPAHGLAVGLRLFLPHGNII